MWYLTKIPKILHVYWGGAGLSYLRYLTIVSFIRHNPDWEVVYYTPLYPTPRHSWTTPEQKYGTQYKDCSNLIKGLDVTINQIDFDSLGFPNNASEVHKSDFIRWRLLNKPGGLWADMDILFTRPMEDLMFNKKEFSDINTVICIGEYGHSIGFIMGGEGNTYFNTIHKESQKAYNKKDYQCIGSLLCNKLFPTLASATVGGTIPYNLPMDVVYSYDFNSYKRLFTTPFPNRITDNTIGVHWYGGSGLAGKYLNKTNGGVDIHGNSIIDQLIVNEKSFILS